jgi:hypothetical protein
MVAGGVHFEIKCTSQSGTGMSANVEPSAGVMHIKGSAITVTYEGCTAFTEGVEGVCTVATNLTTNSLKSTTVSGTMSQKYEPTSGTTFFTILVGGASCPVALKGNKSFTGQLTAGINEATGVQEFTETSGSALKFGGQTAKFISNNKFCTEDGTQVFPRTP